VRIGRRRHDRCPCPWGLRHPPPAALHKRYTTIPSIWKGGVRLPSLTRLGRRACIAAVYAPTRPPYGRMCRCNSEKKSVLILSIWEADMRRATSSKTISVIVYGWSPDIVRAGQQKVNGRNETVSPARSGRRAIIFGGFSGSLHKRETQRHNCRRSTIQGARCRAAHSGFSAKECRHSRPRRHVMGHAYLYFLRDKGGFA
jgi:hypothetical protein